jgi:hypothetical protein
MRLIQNTGENNMNMGDRLYEVVLAVVLTYALVYVYAFLTM